MFISLAQQGSKMPEQGTQEWLDSRKGLMTGSKPANIMFEVKDAMSWDHMWSVWFAGKPDKPFSEEAKRRMAWGSDHEDEAAAQLAREVNGIFFETPLIKHKMYPWIAASPDGLMMHLNDDNTLRELVNVEIKCPLMEYVDQPQKLAQKMAAKKSPPYYYMPQIHFEMCMSGVRKTYFFMWTPVRSHLWVIHFDDDYWRQTVDVLLAFKERIIAWPALEQMILAWKRTSQAFARKHEVFKVIN